MFANNLNEENGENQSRVRFRSPRRCKLCGEVGFHDSRNCPNKKTVIGIHDSINCPNKNTVIEGQSNNNNNSNHVVIDVGELTAQGNQPQIYDDHNQQIADDVEQVNAQENQTQIYDEEYIDEVQNMSHSHMADEEVFNLVNGVEDSKGYKSELESCGSNLFRSADGHVYWVPDVDDAIRPVKDEIYQSYDDVKAMYFYYAIQSGFDVRKSTQKKLNGVITLRYFVCNREGDPHTTAVDTLDSNSRSKKRVDMHRCRCQAGIKCRLIPGTTHFEIYELEEKHNHVLYSKENMHLSRTRRQLDFMQKSFIYKLSTQNVGATKAHRMYASLFGGYSIRGGNVDDFKNFSRDLNCHVKGTDAQLLVNKMINRMNNVTNFTFEYRTDDEKKLNALFWADETAKLHYKEFGDVVSFDATYRTNRYDMVFVPFTGVDNHKKCVTFGGALLSREDADSFVWLLGCFMRAFKKQPILVLTDQDPAIKIAIQHVLNKSIHRLCMWHITAKLEAKVCWELYNDDEFRRRFNSLVWNSRLNVHEFENGWNLFTSEYGLTDNRWFKDMYKLRRFWIPAYFKYVPMCGLMRTTSRSESENASFQCYTNPGTTLVNFMNAFEGAMEKQRHQQSVLDFNDAQKLRQTNSLMQIGVNASNYYTRKIFLIFQKELKHSIVSCFQISKTSDEFFDTCVIVESKQDPNANVTDNNKEDKDDNDSEWDDILQDKEFKVKVNKNEHTFECSCMMFVHVGVLCRHILHVFRYYKITEIPQVYLLRRWRKGIIPIAMLRKTFRYGDMDDGVDRIAFDIFASVDNMVSSLCTDKNKMEEYLLSVKELETRFGSFKITNEQADKSAVYDKFLGVSKADVVEIHNPSGIKNKGRKRLKSSREIMKKKISKDARRCGCCHQVSSHDARNCPKKKTHV